MENKQPTLKWMVWRIGLVFLFTILIWQVILWVDRKVQNGAYSWIEHLSLGVLTSILVYGLMEIARRKDQLSWHQFGMASLRTNLLSFFQGFLLWLVPAIVGLLLCLLFGWVNIDVQSDWSQLIGSVGILLITVFLIEAFPEELIFRGYIYRYVNTMFSHWITVLVQLLLFSLFAYLIGAIDSFSQLQFIPFFALILGYLRAVSRNVWATIGFHTAIMTFTQIVSPLHGHFVVSGFSTLQFVAFILLPSALGAWALDYLYPKRNWREKAI